MWDFFLFQYYLIDFIVKIVLLIVNIHFMTIINRDNLELLFRSLILLKKGV